MRKISTLLIVALAIVANACTHISENAKEDRVDGERVIAEFYEYLKKEDYESTYKLFDARFFAATDTLQLNAIYDYALRELGAVERHVIETSETRAFKGKVNRTAYFHACRVKRTKESSLETFKLEKNNGEIKILSYYVDSKAFRQN